jgi:hypothetical protein
MSQVISKQDINPSYCLATTTNQYKIRNTMHIHAAGRSWGLAKPAFFPTESITRANRAHSQLYFFAILEEENEWMLNLCFLKSQAQKTEFLSVCGF